MGEAISQSSEKRHKINCIIKSTAFILIFIILLSLVSRIMTVNSANMEYQLMTGIYIDIQFSISEEQSVTLLLDCNIIKMLQSFNIQLENQKVLDYIIENKEDAFKQIYDKGFITGI